MRPSAVSHGRCPSAPTIISDLYPINRRGRVMSWSTLKASKNDWLAEKKVNLLFHTGEKPTAATPQTPSIRDLVTKEEDKRALEFILAREIIGRPFIAPPGLPAEITAKLNAEMGKALASPDVKAKLASVGFVPIGDTPEEFTAYLKAEGEKWGKVIRDGKITIGQ